MNAIKARKPHQFVEDPDLRDDRTKTAWCMCGRPQNNAIHELPRRHPDEVEHEQRRMGERR